MQGIVTPSPRKDFQPPLGIFLPSTEKQIILLEKNIILLGKIPVSYAIRTKAWYEKYQYWYKKYQTLVEKVPHLEFGREGRNVERLKLKVERGEF